MGHLQQTMLMGQGLSFSLNPILEGQQSVMMALVCGGWFLFQRLKPFTVAPNTWKLLNLGNIIWIFISKLWKRLSFQINYHLALTILKFTFCLCLMVLNPKHDHFSRNYSSSHFMSPDNVSIIIPSYLSVDNNSDLSHMSGMNLSYCQWVWN